MVAEELVQWTDEFGVGISEIDEQHRGLIALVNRVYAAVIDKADSAEVEDIVHALEHYTVRHFADEERYMIHARYPKFGLHKAVHDQFIERVAAEKDKLKAGFPLDIDIVHFLRDWLVNHILRMDKEFGAYEQNLHADLKRARAGFFSRLFGAGATEFDAPAGVTYRLRAWLLGREPEAKQAAVPRAHAEPTAPATHLAGLDLPGAIEVHMRWKSRFQAVIEGRSEERLDPEAVRADDRCALGLWLHGEGRQRFEGRSEYQDVLMWHAEFHRQAAGILAAAEIGDRERAAADLEHGPYMLAAIRLRGSLSRMFVATAA